MNRNLSSLLEIALITGTLSVAACTGTTSTDDGVCDDMVDNDPDCEAGCPEQGCPESGCPESGCPS